MSYVLKFPRNRSTAWQSNLYCLGSNLKPNIQECIPVGCVPSSAVAVSLAMHAPPLLPHMPPPPPCMPPTTMHAPHHHACPPAMHTRCYTGPPPPCMPPLHHTHPPFAMYHAPPLAMHAPSPPPPDRRNVTRLWKHYLSATTVADGNNKPQINTCQCGPMSLGPHSQTHPAGHQGLGPSRPVKDEVCANVIFYLIFIKSLVRKH